MRRPHKKDTPRDVHSTGDIKKDLTEKQLVAFGAAALAYNILDGAFGEFKKIRDAMVHARVINASIASDCLKKCVAKTALKCC